MGVCRHTSLAVAEAWLWAWAGRRLSGSPAYRGDGLNVRKSPDPKGPGFFVMRNKVTQQTPVTAPQLS
jgi:hypothetical protein